MKLQRLRWWQIEDIMPIEEDLFGEERWTAPMFWNELANGHLYLAAMEDEQLIGYGGLAMSPPDEAWINNVAVRRENQGQGVGRVIVETLIEAAERTGIRQTLLEVSANNVPAQRLYESLGFVVIGVRKGYYQPSNTDAWVMSRDN
jgi:ribosomal-protein-alanine N-acetyltransferase